MPILCYKCQTELKDFEEGHRVGRDEDCPHCKTSLRCCKMCLFYDPNSYNECKEPVAQRIVEKEKANFCDYFKLGSVNNNNSSTDKLLEEANKLFKF